MHGGSFVFRRDNTALKKPQKSREYSDYENSMFPLKFSNEAFLLTIYVITFQDQNTKWAPS